MLLLPILKNVPQTRGNKNYLLDKEFKGYLVIGVVLAFFPSRQPFRYDFPPLAAPPPKLFLADSETFFLPLAHWRILNLPWRGKGSVSAIRQKSRFVGSFFCFKTFFYICHRSCLGRETQ